MAGLSLGFGSRACAQPCQRGSRLQHELCPANLTRYSIPISSVFLALASSSPNSNHITMSSLKYPSSSISLSEKQVHNSIALTQAQELAAQIDLEKQFLIISPTHDRRKKHGPRTRSSLDFISCIKAWASTGDRHGSQP